MIGYGSGQLAWPGAARLVVAGSLQTHTLTTFTTDCTYSLPDKEVDVDDDVRKGRECGGFIRSRYS